MSGHVAASVVVCTARRPRYLADCLNSLLLQSLPASDFEVVVVNNAPETDEEIASLVLGITGRDRCRYVVEETEGLSAARNRGIATSRGDVIVFLDDDAKAHPDWLRSLLEVYRQEPQAAAVGGRIALYWEVPAPRWLHTGLYPYLGELNLGPGVFRIRAGQSLFGGNLSVRRQWVERCGGFSTRLGRDKRSLLSGEELEFERRIQNAGGECYYTSDAIVDHPAHAGRVNRRFFRARAYWGARSGARIDLMHSPRGVPRTLIAKLVRLPVYAAGSLASWLVGQSARAFLWQTNCWATLGYWAEVVGSAWRGNSIAERQRGGG